MNIRDNSSTDDELALLREEGRQLGMPGQITREAVGLQPVSVEDLLARIKAPTESSSAREPGVVPIRPRRRVVVRLIVAAALIAGVLGAVLNPWQQRPAVADTPPVLDYEFANARDIAYAPGEDASPTLMRLARTADSQLPVERKGSTQFLLTENWFVDLEDSREVQLIPRQRESWLSPDGSRRIRETAGTPLAADGRGLKADDVPAQAGAIDETYPPDGLDAQLIDKLGTNTDDVRNALLDLGECEDRQVGPARASCLYQEVVALYARYVIPSDMAATFWRVLAAEPTMRSLGSVRDRAGREGVGISYVPADAPEFRKVLIISRGTGELLGTEDILIKSEPDLDVKAPAIYGFTAILTARYTSESGPVN